MKTSCFENLKKTKVKGYESIDSVLDKISNGYTRQTVLPARNAGRGTKLYNKLKASTPTWTPNASFAEIRKKRNIKNLTGYIYLDIDDPAHLNAIKSIPFVYAAWESFSGDGYGILVKVNNLGLYNFHSVWAYLKEDFADRNINVDPQTKDITRQNVISYDPNLYHNPKCNPLNANDIVSNNTMIPFEYNWDMSEYHFKDPVSTNTGTTYSNFRNNYFDADLVYKTILNDYQGMDYVVINQGKAYRDCYVPKSVEDGKRHRWIAGRTISLLFNNPDITYENLLNNTLFANKQQMSPPKQRKEVEDLVKYLYEKHQARNLNYNPRMKKIWFDPDADLTTTEKRSIVGKESAKLKRAKTLGKLQECYILLSKSNKRVTQKMVAELSGKSIRTIKNYWHQII